MAEIIAVANHKGGVGKTTSVVNIGSYLAGQGKEVLLIDTDPQAHLTKSFKWEGGIKHKSIYDIFKTSKMFWEAVPDHGNLYIITSNLELSNFEFEAGTQFKRETILSRLFMGLDPKFEYIILDCPPNLGLLTINALCYAEHILVPLSPEILPLDGLDSLLRMLKLVKKELNPDLNILGIFLNRVDLRLNLARNIRTILQEDYKDALLEAFIRDNVSVAEAPAKRQSIFDYKPKSTGAEDYEKLTVEILKKLEV
jgi:chromosome partitioning protein